MRRVASIVLPSWPVDRRHRRNGGGEPAREGPLVLSLRAGGRRILHAADAAAQALGLHAGMPVAKAQALVPDLLVREADPAGDLAGLEQLALWMARLYAPIVMVEPPDGIVLDTTGADHLHGGEEAMLAAMIERLTRAGIAARIAVADSRSAAHALARFAGRPICIVPSGETEDALVPLPVAALRLPPEIVGGLETLGLGRIGDLLAQPRAPLVRRFGPELGRRIDQALGITGDPIDPIRPPDPIESRLAFSEPIGAAETIARAIGDLVPHLCAELERRGLGGRQFDLVCHRVDAQAQAVRIGTARPVRDAGRLIRLLCERIERIDPGFGIEIMVLVASRTEPLARQQTVAAFTDAPDRDVSDLADILTNRVGARRLYGVAPVESDVPERSLRRRPPLACGSGATWPGGWPRPARLLPRPEAIETVALLPDHPPVAFTWRGTRRRVARADGPERIFGEWWKREAELLAVRDYFRVEDESGRRYWIFRSGDGEDPATGSQRWFLHGVFG